MAVGQIVDFTLVCRVLVSISISFSDMIELYKLITGKYDSQLSFAVVFTF